MNPLTPDPSPARGEGRRRMPRGGSLKGLSDLRWPRRPTLGDEQAVGDVVGERGLLAGDGDGDRAGFGPVGDDLALSLQAEARFGEVAEEFGRLLEDADDAEALADLDLRQATAGGARDGA